MSGTEYRNILADKLDEIERSIAKATLEDLLDRRAAMVKFIDILSLRERSEGGSYLRRQRKRAGKILLLIQEQLGSKREERRRANILLANTARDEFYAAYYRVAKQLLTNEVHMNIYAEATRVLGREFTESVP